MVELTGDHRPVDKATAYDLANAPIVTWWLSSGGRIELAVKLRDAHVCAEPGQDASEAVAELLTANYIAEQLAEIPDDVLRDELSEYGAWDDEQLADRAQNLARLVWLACGDIADNYAGEHG